MPKAVEYVTQVHDQIGSLDELLQMAIINVIRLDCKADSTHRVSAHNSCGVRKLNVNVCIQPRWIRCIFELLNASSHAVQYEAATTLTGLTQHAAAVKGLYI
jgi:coatomer subunit beta